MFDTELIHGNVCGIIWILYECSGCHIMLPWSLRICCHVPFELVLLLTVLCILLSLFQVKCSMLLWPVRWLLRKPVQSVGTGKLSWHPRASSTLHGDKAWTDVTMAGSPMAVYDTLWQYPDCSAGEAWSEYGPCTATETRLASQNQPGSLGLTVLKVQLLAVCGC